MNYLYNNYRKINIGGIYMKKINQFIIRDVNNLENIINICSLNNIVVYTVKLKQDDSLEYVIDEVYKDIIPNELIQNKQIEYVEGLEIHTSSDVEER